MIFAPANSCMMIDAVTIGPIPRCISEPWAPARMARRLEKKSMTLARSRPEMKMFVMAKYRTKIARTQNIFVRKCTWPSGRVTAGSRSVIGFRRYRRLFFFSSRGIGLLPGVPWEDDLAASAGDLREGGLGGFRHRDPHRDRYPARA